MTRPLTDQQLARLLYDAIVACEPHEYTDFEEDDVGGAALDGRFPLGRTARRFLEMVAAAEQEAAKQNETDTGL